MHNPEERHPTSPKFEPGTCEFRATTKPNEPSGPASLVVWSHVANLHTHSVKSSYEQLDESLRHGRLNHRDTKKSAFAGYIYRVKK